jgi:hypothetical protein
LFSYSPTAVALREIFPIKPVPYRFKFTLFESAEMLRESGLRCDTAEWRARLRCNDIVCVRRRVYSASFGTGLKAELINFDQILGSRQSVSRLGGVVLLLNCIQSQQSLLFDQIARNFLEGRFRIFYRKNQWKIEAPKEIRRP